MPLRSYNSKILFFCLIMDYKEFQVITEGSIDPNSSCLCIGVEPVLIFPHEGTIDQSILGYFWCEKKNNILSSGAVGP